MGPRAPQSEPSRGRRAARRLGTGLAGLLAAVAVAATGASAPAAAVDSGAGPGPRTTTKKAIWGPLELGGESLFPRYRDLGAGIYQSSLRWNQIAVQKPEHPTDPDDPAYKWPSYLDIAAEQADAHGMEVMVMLIGTPAWANGRNDWRWPPDRAEDFADFARAAETRYPNVNLWMVWGEPNRRPNFGPLVPAGWRGKLNKRQRRAPRMYASLLDATYGALKDESPENLVIGGNTYTSAGKGVVRPYQWIRYMRLPGGKRPRLDMWGHNPFSFKKPNLKSRPSVRGAVTFSDLRRLARAIDRARFRGARHPKLYLAEWGVPTGFVDRDLLYKLKHGVAKQWVRAALRITRRWGRIYTLGWVHPLDTDESSIGLMRGDGRPKPTYEAFRSG